MFNKILVKVALMFLPVLEVLTRQNVNEYNIGQYEPRATLESMDIS